jgi:UDP-N-acetylglucosamine/UDP-N-acetylgalactosamine diphosphorylase
MAGGTDEKNHSEVGSSYIHFNYTPNQDKATASLIGDVARGVMLNQSPIFLGGQGGMVGPVMIEYGNVVAAGTIVRKDLLKQDSMLLGHQAIARSMPFKMGLYSNVNRIIKLNTIYIANLIALRRWYLDVRSIFMQDKDMGTALYNGALEKLDMALTERIKRLGAVAAKMPESIEILGGKDVSGKVIEKKKEFINKWDDMKQGFSHSLDYEGKVSLREQFLEAVEESVKLKGKDYITSIKGLGDKESSIGVSWMQGIVDEICGKTWELLPGLNIK